jgi:hypothetical protein
VSRDPDRTGIVVVTIPRNLRRVVEATAERV